MVNKREQSSSGKTFAGIQLPPEIKWINFFNLYLASYCIACLITLPAIIQPAFLKEVINIPKEQAGSINSALQNMSQIAWLLFAGFAGILSDKVGRRILVIIGFIVAGIFYISFGYTKEICLAIGITSVGWQIFATFVVRFMIGLGIILAFPQTSTMCADYSYPPDRGKAMAYQGITISLGSITTFGILAQLAKKTGLISLFYIAGIACAVGLIVTVFGLVDRMAKEKAAKIKIKELYTIITGSIPLKVSYIVSLIVRVDILIISTYLIVWMVYAAERIGIDPIKATAKGGLILLVMALISLAVWPIVGILLDKWGRSPVIIISVVSTFIGYFLIALTENPFSPALYLHVSLIGIGFSAASAGTAALAADGAPKPLLGSIMGSINAVQAVGTLFFLQAGGILLDKLGYWSPFLMKGTVNLLCCIWVVAVRKGIDIPRHKEA